MAHSIEQFDFSALRVLVIDDNDFVRFMLKKYLQEFGFVDIYEAADGDAASKLLISNPDLIICDINMTPVNGFDFLQHVRGLPIPASKVPFIYLTGNASLEFVTRAKSLNVDAYLLKPVAQEHLRQKVMQLLTKALVY